MSCQSHLIGICARLRSINLRKLEKLSKPSILVEKGDEWTREYLEAKSGDKRPPSRWRHHQIKDSVSKETSDRCAYCDSEMKSVHFGHIEHIVPRSAVPEKVVEWENLTLACEQCNNAKSDYYSQVAPIINPYLDEPSEHLIFLGDMVVARPTSDRGIVTVQKLGLLRKDLTESRKSRIQAVLSLVRNWSTASDPEIKQTLLEIIIDDYQNGAYKNSVRAVLLECEVDPHLV